MYICMYVCIYVYIYIYNAKELIQLKNVVVFKLSI